VPSENGTFLASSCCPYFARFCPQGRDHTYDLCEAAGTEPFVPSQSELSELCHGEFSRCPRFQFARQRETDDAHRPDRRAA
jgi:hypothetical protein